MRRGPYGKNRVLAAQHEGEIVKLRKEGFGYRTIAKQLNVPQHLVEYLTRHIHIDLGDSIRKGNLYSRKDIPFEQVKTKQHKRKFIIRERGHRCQKCGLTEWNGKPITLELHNHSQLKEKCLLLCPNCHSQTEDWRGRKTPL